MYTLAICQVRLTKSLSIIKVKSYGIIAETKNNINKLYTVSKHLAALLASCYGNTATNSL